jgi:hypothetical protein
MQIAFCYGLICYLLGTSLGFMTPRLIGYGWPLFWLWLPIQLSDIAPGFSNLRIVSLAVCSLTAAWIPHLEGFRDLAPKYTLWLLLVPALFGATWVLLTKPGRLCRPVPVAVIKLARQV